MTETFISIAVSTKDRRADLAKLLATLRELDYPKDKLEIVIVEEGDHPDPIDETKYVFIPRLNKGFSYTRNVAVRNCSHDWIAFVDDDCEVPPEWLRALASHAREDIAGIVGSVRVRNCGVIGICENILGYPGGGLAAIENASGRVRPTEGLVTCNALLRRDAIRAAGGFDENEHVICGGEDNLLALHLTRKGFKLLFDPRAVVYHKTRDSLVAIFKWAFRMGKGHTLLNSYLHGQSFPLRVLRRSVSLKLLLFVAGLFVFSGYLLPYVFLVLLGFFAKTNLSYRFHRKYIRNWRIFFVLPVVKIAFGLGEDAGRIGAFISMRKTEKG